LEDEAAAEEEAADGEDPAAADGAKKDEL